MARTRSVVLLLAVGLAVASCSGTRSASDPTKQQQQTGTLSYVFVPAGIALRKKCLSVARSLRYPIPCLSEVPEQMTYLGRVAFIAQGPLGPWRRWAVGSTSVGAEHLVATASPRPITNYSKVVNGPAWYPNARVRPLASVTINGWRMRAVYVPPETNDGSAFAHHVVLIWTVGQHTYGVGFHNLYGLRETLRLDEDLARHFRLVGP